MRILIVEDEQHLRDNLVENLSKRSYAVDAAEDGQHGAYLAENYPYDLAIIDLGLPKLTGIDLIKFIRAKNCNFPILILTARSDWQDKVEGLNAGADDYLTKPFHFEELAARINALLRRNAGHTQAVLQFGPLCLNTASKTAEVDGRILDLTSYEYNTLEYLAHKAGQVISKTELTEHLYDQDFDRDSNVIEVFIGRLRKKIDPDNRLKPITTVRGQGYRFSLEHV